MLRSMIYAVVGKAASLLPARHLPPNIPSSLIQVAENGIRDSLACTRATCLQYTSSIAQAILNCFRKGVLLFAMLGVFEVCSTDLLQSFHAGPFGFFGVGYNF